MSPTQSSASADSSVTAFLLSFRSVAKESVVSSVQSGQKIDKNESKPERNRMLIPSIDLMGGRIVQLVQGEKMKLAFDDFEYWIERFSKYPIVQLIDLDAAMRQGENRSLIEMICKRLPCQVGGGLKTAEDGRIILEAGAKRVIYGSSLFGPAEPNEPRRHKLIRLQFAEELKKTLGEEALVFSVDTKAGKVAIKGCK